MSDLGLKHCWPLEQWGSRGLVLGALPLHPFSVTISKSFNFSAMGAKWKGNSTDAWGGQVQTTLGSHCPVTVVTTLPR